MKIDINCTVQELADLVRVCTYSREKHDCRGCVFACLTVNGESCTGIENIAAFKIGAAGGKNG